MRCETCPAPEGEPGCPDYVCGYVLLERSKPEGFRPWTRKVSRSEAPKAVTNGSPGAMPDGVRITAGDGYYREIQALDQKVKDCPDRTVIEQTRCGCLARCRSMVQGGIVRLEHCRACQAAGGPESLSTSAAGPASSAVAVGRPPG